MLWDGGMSWVPLPETLTCLPEGVFPHHSPVIKHSQPQQALELPTALAPACLLQLWPRIKAGAGKDQGFYSYKVITVR